MATITLDAVKKRYGKTDVIHGVDVDIADGELIVIVGPSGCGKSTLLRMVAGLEEVSDGVISIDGRRVNEVEPKDRNIAMVFQTYALYPHMSVFDNMAYGLKIAGLPKSEITSRVEEAARLLALGELLQRKPKALSGGQRQRVAMGRAIVRQPAVFLFDEPLSNLDALLRVQMRLEIKQLQRRLNTTSLYVTHDQVEAMTLADRLVVMNGGVAEQIDTPMAVYEKPASRFVASFIGSPGMNFLEGELDAASSRLMLANGSGIRLPDTCVKALTQGSEDAPNPSGRPIVAGFRPEHLELAGSGATNPDLSIDVLSVETLGADTLLHGVLAGSTESATGNLVDRASDAVSVRVTGAARVAEGQSCGLNVSLGGWHFFDPATGVRLG